MTELESSIARTFVELADTLVADFDLVDFLHLLTQRCREVVGADAAGLLLADHHGTLNVVAASSEQARLLELFQLQNAEGPCFDCYRTGRPVQCPDLAAERDHWPLFTDAALEAGFTSVHAMPLRLRQTVIGALNLFSGRTGPLESERLRIGQAFADVATIGILHERAANQHALLTEQLQTALNSRLAIEQAKGVLAERTGRSIDEAFTMLRAYARSNRRRLLDVAQAVVRNDADIADLVAQSRLDPF